MRAIDKPLAAQGYTSYRYRSPYNWIMIGAGSHAEALEEANRSLSAGTATPDNLEVWGGTKYIQATD